MDKLFLPLGRLAGAAGLLLCLISGSARLVGMHWIGGFETLTLLQAGIAGTVIGCFCLLAVLTRDAN